MQGAGSGHSVEVTGTDRHCPAGERAGSQNLRDGKVPVLSCEGACIRGEIARLAANMVAKEEPYRRGCHGELLTVPGSAMAKWMTTADQIVLIDGCALRCHGRVLEHLVPRERLVEFDALSHHRRYGEHFDIDAVPEAERKETARLVADAVLAELGRRAAAARPEGAPPGPRMHKANLDASEPHVHGRVRKESLAVDGVTVTRVTFHPGARWTEDVAPAAGTGTCLAPHVALVLSGALRVRMDDGSEEEFQRNDVMLLPSGHDAWTVGDEPCVFIEFSQGYDRYETRAPASGEQARFG